VIQRKLGLCVFSNQVICKVHKYYACFHVPFQITVLLYGGLKSQFQIWQYFLRIFLQKLGWSHFVLGIFGPLAAIWKSAVNDEWIHLRKDYKEDTCTCARTWCSNWWKHNQMVALIKETLWWTTPWNPLLSHLFAVRVYSFLWFLSDVMKPFIKLLWYHYISRWFYFRIFRARQSAGNSTPSKLNNLTLLFKI
jgi:hypothetical protein